MPMGGVPGIDYAVGTCAGDEVAAQPLYLAHSCRRLGRTANPPSTSLTGWLRSGLRR